jgi:hypothetical protein
VEQEWQSRRAPGWEADEEEAERNADPTMDEDLKKWTGDGEGRYARLEGELEEMERELVGEALTAWLASRAFAHRRWDSKPRSCWRRSRGRSPRERGTSRS